MDGRGVGCGQGYRYVDRWGVCRMTKWKIEGEVDMIRHRYDKEKKV